MRDSSRYQACHILMAVQDMAEPFLEGIQCRWLVMGSRAAKLVCRVAMTAPHVSDKRIILMWLQHRGTRGGSFVLLAWWTFCCGEYYDMIFPNKLLNWNGN
jgi:hypothetical protein